MHFMKVQISELMRKHAEKENGLHDLMEIKPESMMVAERSEFLHENPQNKGNGYRFGHAYGQGRKLEFRIPRDRYGNFHPRILAILRNQEEECDQWPESYIPKDLRRNRSEMSLSRFTGCTIPSPASAGWPIAFVPR